MVDFGLAPAADEDGRAEGGAFDFFFSSFALMAVSSTPEFEGPADCEVCFVGRGVLGTEESSTVMGD